MGKGRRKGLGRRAVGQGALALLLAGGAVVLALAQAAEAKPAHLKVLAEHYGSFLPVKLNNCTTCHLPAAPGKSPTSLADFPHNPFGKRLASLREELRAAGKRADLAVRLRVAAGEDSDGDRAANEMELLAGRRPGDPQDRPTPSEVTAVVKQRPRLQAFQAAYRWRPFEPVKQPAVPKVKNVRWVRNPIDAFIAAEHERRGVTPRPEASREVLLRRVYLDLIGLAPTPEERRAFLADRSPDAYEKVVDRLLASPAYGERWARHWMDIWRYSDWTGFGEQVRDSKPHVWRWRDWIVESLNADKGYDRMVVEMLAGDEAFPEDPDALRGTGYLVRNFKLLSREKWLQDTVDHTGQAFLGLTVGCARCHDHMYDPIEQKEYYRLRAIFEPHHVRTDWVPGELDVNRDGLPRAYDAKPDAPTYFFVRGDERQPVKDEPLAPGVPEALGGVLKIEPVPLPVLARVPEKQPHVIAALRAQAAGRVEEARKALQACRTEAETTLARLKLAAAEFGQAALEAVLRVEALEDGGTKGTEEWKREAEATVAAQRLLAAAEAERKQLEAARAAAQAESQASTKPDALKKLKDALTAADAELSKARTELGAPPSTAYKPRIASAYPEASTGRRLAFARWLTAADNPLTARVAVNHVWLRHFGQALVPSVADFGRSGVPPTHPELLDWLAAGFATGQYGGMGVWGYGGKERSVTPTPPYPHTPTPSSWSMKRLHRLIVTSSAYRMASTPDARNAAKDPDNRYLWRMNSRRLDAELVRDNVLYVAGQLDRKMGGADIDQNLGLTVKRRSIYFRHAQEKEMVFLSLFDGPSVVECYARKQTVVPQQALALANSELTLVQARLLARTLSEQVGSDPAAFVTAAFERVLCRLPTAAERTECLGFLAEQAKLAEGTAVEGTASGSPDRSGPAGDPAFRAREMLALVLLNHNDFITVR